MKTTLHSFFIFGAVTLATITFADPAHAGRYELIKGKGVEVCEAYKKNIESFHDTKPMACERKINPEFKDFEKPAWEKVNLEEHRGLFRRLLKYNVAWDEDQFRKGIYDDDAELGARIKFHKDRGFRFISWAKFDVDNDNKPDNILIYRDGICPDTSTSYFSTNLYVLSGEIGQSDVAIDASNPTQKIIHKEISRGSGGGIAEDIFRYKKVTYIDKFCTFQGEGVGCDAADRLIVYKISGKESSTVCTYQYVN